MIKFCIIKLLDIAKKEISYKGYKSIANNIKFRKKINKNEYYNMHPIIFSECFSGKSSIEYIYFKTIQEQDISRLTRTINITEGIQPIFAKGSLKISGELLNKKLKL